MLQPPKAELSKEAEELLDKTQDIMFYYSSWQKWTLIFRVIQLKKKKKAKSKN